MRKLRCRLVPVGDKGASGYHYHPAVRCTRGDIDQLVEREKQRGENGAKFYRKHKNMRVGERKILFGRCGCRRLIPVGSVAVAVSGEVDGAANAVPPGALVDLHVRRFALS